MAKRTVLEALLDALFVEEGSDTVDRADFARAEAWVERYARHVPALRGALDDAIKAAMRRNAPEASVLQALIEARQWLAEAEADR